MHLLASKGHEVHGVELGLAAVLSTRVDGGLEEVEVADAGDLHGILERQEQALARPLLGRELEEILAFVEHLAVGDLVFFAPRQDVGQGALARAVGAHDGVDLAGVDLQIDSP